MDIQIPYSIIFTFLCFVFIINRLKKSQKTLPPGPRKLPLIGNLHQLGSLPHRSCRELASKYGPLMHLQLGQMSYVVVSSKEVAKDVMRTHDMIFANRPKLVAADFFYNGTDISFSPYGSYWRQLRKICTLELLSVTRVRTFRRIREDEVFAFVKHISEHELGSAVNLSKKLCPLTNTIVARAALGRKTKNLDKVLSIFRYVLELTGGLSLADLYPALEFLRVINGSKAKAEKVRKDLDMILNGIINDHLEKKAGPKEEETEEDFVDVLLRIQKEDDLDIPLTLDNIKVIILDMLFGGTETEAITIEWALAEMVKNPEVMKKAQEEVRRVYGSKGYVDESEVHQLPYVAAVIRETLRLHPPGPLLMPREISETCKLYGYKLPPKTKVFVNVWAIARDPKYWDEPDSFKPERFIDGSIDYRGASFEYMPFGGGRRICPGISFATAVLDLTIANLLYHFDWKVPNGKRNEELDMTEVFLSTVRRKDDLCLVPIAYRP